MSGKARSILVRACLGGGVGLGLFVLAEGLMRLFMGPTPAAHGVAPAEDCGLEAGATSMTWRCTGSRIQQLEIPLQASGPRVVVLGGSSMSNPFGDQDDVSDVLAAAMPGVEVLNFGRAGARMEDLRKTAEAMAPLHPDLVVVYSGHNELAQKVFDGQVHDVGLTGANVHALLSRTWTYNLLGALFGDWMDPGGGPGGPPSGDLPPPGPGTLAATGPPPPKPALAPSPHAVGGMGPAPRGPGTDPAAGPPPAGGPPGHPSLRVPPEACSRTETGWRGTLVVSDDAAIRERSQTLREVARDLDALLEALTAPVLLLHPISNSEHPPAGTLAVSKEACQVLVSCIASVSPSLPWDLAVADAEEQCGPDAAWTWWARAQQAHLAGEDERAWEAVLASADQDALPLRVGSGLDLLLANAAAARSGVRLVDLREVLGPWTGTRLFMDQLHFSQAGAEAVAGAILPEVRRELGLPEAALPREGGARSGPAEPGVEGAEEGVLPGAIGGE